MRSKSVPVNLLIRKIHSALGEGGEEGSPEESEKLEGEEDTGSMTPTSVASPQPGEDGSSPLAGNAASPGSPRSLSEDITNIREQPSRGTSRASSSSPPSSEPMLPPDRAALLQGVSLGAALSPVGVALPPTLPAALLPPQSAAVAAYFSAAAAAAAAQQHRLMLGAAPLVSPPSDPPVNAPDAALDFSRRRDDEPEVQDPTPSPPATSGPLDLSVGARKRLAEDTATPPPPRKQRTEFKPPQWHLPYFAAAVAAAGLASPKSSATPELWNGKLKTTPPSEATKALEKMSELSKLGGDELFRQTSSAPAGGRHSAWQSHWLNKGADQAKDVLKCVWCKQSFASLAALTTHMKEAKHCGVSVPPPSSTAPIQPAPTSPPAPPKPELNALIKETMPLPRKLVRGQDVWLGKGAEQTRQILKCMWCGQSFRSLAEMTSHMQQTQHYTNIISQEQIISWRSSDDSKSSGGGSNNSGGQPPPASSHVSAVLTCKVCDQAFSSLKELSNHMVKNSHYKEHIMRSITESGGRRRQTREKRKKSLPVRKLLELERAQHDFKNGESSGLLEKVRDAAAAGRITCEKCGHKIETALFVDHIRQCVGASVSASQRNFLKSALMSNILPPESPTRDKIKTPSDKSPSPQQRSPSVSDTSSKEPASENNNGSSPSVLNAIEKLIEKSFDSRSRQNPSFPGPTQAPMGSSILKRLGIDESVDYTKPLVDPQTMSLLRSYHHQQSHHFGRRERSGSESSTMSERGSSRVDSLTPERKMEPPGIPLSSTPRSTPDIKRERSEEKDEEKERVVVKKEIMDDEERVETRTPEVKVKKEIEDNEEDERNSFHSNGEVNKEEDDRKKTPLPSPSLETARPTTPCRNSISPASSDRSGTPRSTTSDRKSAGGSLGALSSMFDNLSGVNSSNDAQPSGKKGSSHPLAALQKLCDKTETHTAQNNRSHPSSTSTATSVATTSGATTPGAILAFSWACNDAVVTPDSIMKCAFCDTPFISKGAYRHHLSKMHFVKDGVIPDPVTLKGGQGGSGGAAGVPLKSTAVPPSVVPPAPVPKSPPGAFEESPHSKFLKYTELAKQLSSKYV